MFWVCQEHPVSQEHKHLDLCEYKMALKVHYSGLEVPDYHPMYQEYSFGGDIFKGQLRIKEEFFKGFKVLCDAVNSSFPVGSVVLFITVNLISNCTEEAVPICFHIIRGKPIE